MLVIVDQKPSGELNIIRVMLILTLLLSILNLIMSPTSLLNLLKIPEAQSFLDKTFNTTTETLLVLEKLSILNIAFVRTLHLSILRNIEVVGIRDSEKRGLRGDEGRSTPSTRIEYIPQP